MHFVLNQPDFIFKLKRVPPRVAAVCPLPALPVEDVLWATRGCWCSCLFAGGRHTPLAVRGRSYKGEKKTVRLTNHDNKRDKYTCTDLSCRKKTEKTQKIEATLK